MTSNDKTYTVATKAYKNMDFLNSESARNIRIMCEYEETFSRLKKHNVHASIVIFGSARSLPSNEHAEKKSKLQEEREQLLAKGEPVDAIDASLERMQATEWMCEYFDKIVELSRLLTEWSISSGISLAKGRRITGVSRYNSFEHDAKSLPESPKRERVRHEQSFVVTTGGGPGFMEAANKGAAMVPNAMNMGMGISLPFEAGLNRYVSDELAFQFHYFFTRKFWMVYHCQALVAAPGGVGTMDELFEVLTLKQTGKVHKDLPVVLFGEKFWRTIVNWQALVDYGVVSQKDVDDLFFTDSAEDAFRYIITKLQTNPIFTINAEDFDLLS